jgi:hypothetical protein
VRGKYIFKNGVIYEIYIYSKMKINFLYLFLRYMYVYVLARAIEHESNQRKFLNFNYFDFHS